MEKIITTSEYGYSIFSVEAMTEFLSAEKIKSKKVLALLQKDKKKYLKSLETGSWLPIPSADMQEIVISVAGYDEEFSGDWKEVLSYDGFNILVKNGLWITDIGGFLNFEVEQYQGDGTEIPGSYGNIKYYSSKEKWYTTMDGEINYTGFCYDVPDGKYVVSLIFYARKEIVDIRDVNYGMKIILNKVDDFVDCKNPREDEYNFKINWLSTSKEAIITWLPAKESGVKWPLKSSEFKGTITVPSGEDKPAILITELDINNQTEDLKTPCRVKTGIRKPEKFSLESGKEYPISEEIYKRGKYIYKELGTISIK